MNVDIYFNKNFKIQGEIQPHNASQQFSTKLDSIPTGFATEDQKEGFLAPFGEPT